MRTTLAAVERGVRRVGACGEWSATRVAVIVSVVWQEEINRETGSVMSFVWKRCSLGCRRHTAQNELSRRSTFVGLAVEFCRPICINPPPSIRFKQRSLARCHTFAGFNGPVTVQTEQPAHTSSNSVSYSMEE